MSSIILNKNGSASPFLNPLELETPETNPGQNSGLIVRWKIPSSLSEKFFLTSTPENNESICPPLKRLKLEGIKNDPEQNSGLIAQWKIPSAPSVKFLSTPSPENSWDFSFDESSSSSCEEEEEQALIKIRTLENLEKLKIPQRPIDNSHFYYTASVRKINAGKKAATVLTGNFIRHLIPKDANHALRENLTVAKKIIQFVDKHVPFSENYLQRSAIFAKPGDDPEDLISDHSDIKKNLDILWEKIETTQKIFDLQSDSNDEDRFLKLRYAVKQILRYKTGNCFELSQVGYYFAQKCGILNQTSVEIAFIENGDHTILIIGRDQNSIISDFKNWGSAVICDLWSGSFYPASKLKKHLTDYVKAIEIKRFQYTQVQLFNPLKQAIRLWPM
jgi:hypothetical protein